MPVALVAPGTTQNFQVLSATEVVTEIQTRVPWPKFHTNYLKILTKQDKFPAPWIEIGGRRGWLQQDVDTWIAQKAAGARERAIEESAQSLAGLKGKELDKALAELKAKITAAQ